MKSKFYYVLFIAVLGYITLLYNYEIISTINTHFNIEFVAKENYQKNIMTPVSLIDDVKYSLSEINSLTDDEKEVVLQEIPKIVDYEYRQGPYKNIFDFSVFDKKNKQSGILLVGDSTLSWGFSIGHLEKFSGVEVHALTYGLNIMDDVLLQATDRIIQCFYKEPPAVLLSNSLESMGKKHRLNRVQDAAIIEISNTKNCEQLYKLVSERRKIGGEKINFSDVFDFRKYRKKIDKVKPVMNVVSHVDIHKIIEPEKFRKLDNSAKWSFIRWVPEFRLPVILNKKHKNKVWKYIDGADEINYQYFLNKYAKNNVDTMLLIKDRHRHWFDRNACFIVPLTINAQSLIRKYYSPDKRTCWVNFPDIAKANPKAVIKMQSKHHLGSSGGIVFASLVGKSVKSMALPQWE